MPTIADVAEYVREEWASHGVEVQATGKRSITLLLPPELMGMTELCFELFNEFGATTDFKHATTGATITVWMPTIAVDDNPRPPRRQWLTVAVAITALGAIAATDVGAEWATTISTYLAYRTE